MKELQRQFINLTVKERVERVNTALKTKPLKQVATELTGCSVTWLRDHMVSIGYEYRKSLAQYVKSEERKEPVEACGGDDGLQELLAVKDRLLALVHKPQTAQFDFGDLYAQGAVVTRSLKTYSGVLEAFDQVCDRDYPQFRKQDLLGFALQEFVKHYGSNSQGLLK